MKKVSECKKNCEGSALMIVLLVVIISTVLLSAFFSSSMGRSFMARKLSDRVRAIAIAEAGVNEAYSILATNFNARENDDAFPATAYGDGMYDVTVIPVSNNVAVISSAGTCGSVTEIAILDIKNYGNVGSSRYSWDFEAFDYAMVAGGTFDFRGCGDVSSATGGVAQGLIHANGDMSIKGDAAANIGISSSTEISIGNNITIDGDVTAPELDYKASKVTITGTPSEEAVPLVVIPDIDLTPFYNWAAANGEVHNGFSFSGTSYTPNGGILWVNGDVTISSHAVINGSIIATGDINISGAVDVHAPNNGFAIASRDGSIKNTSSGEITGLIYAKVGDYDHTANGKVVGQVIVGGDIKKSGNSDVWLFSKTDLTDPGSTGDDVEENAIGASAWQR